MVRFAFRGCGMIFVALR